MNYIPKEFQKAMIEMLDDPHSLYNVLTCPPMFTLREHMLMRKNLNRPKNAILDLQLK